MSLTAQTEDSQGAHELIERFVNRAFRGVEPDPIYLDKLVALFEEQRRLGASFQEALKEPPSVVLASPSFLYLQEPVDDGGCGELNSYELATRLSYFLWSSPPDDERLALADSDALQQPEVLSAEVDRMLDDERSRQFVVGWIHQWLGRDRLDFFNSTSDCIAALMTARKPPPAKR